MTDIVPPDKRSQMMANIKGKNTKPEMAIRSALHRRGFRYRLHDKSLPGKPDLVFSKYDAVIFVHGCFWHGHDCHLFKWPTSREDFWRTKITRNKQVDNLNETRIRLEGLRVGIVWECAIRGKTKLPFDEIITTIADWLVNGESDIEIRSY